MAAKEGHERKDRGEKEGRVPEDAPIWAEDQAPESLADGRGEPFAAVKMIASVEGVAEADLVVPEQEPAADQEWYGESDEADQQLLCAAYCVLRVAIGGGDSSPVVAWLLENHQPARA